jgi:hypothetical protein
MARKSALVTCHAERPLDDEAWRRLRAVLRRRPGGFAVVPLLRPPDSAGGEDEDEWLARAREAAALGPIGLHTHWTSASHARPSNGDPAARVREQLAWLRARGLDPRYFCGGGWYTDPEVQAVVAAEGLVDCTATTFVPPVPEPYRRVNGPEPGLLPATHSLGMLVRSVLGPLPRFVHVYFHDTDLRDARRRFALVAALTVLGWRRRPFDRDAVQS